MAWQIEQRSHGSPVPFQRRGQAGHWGRCKRCLCWGNRGDSVPGFMCERFCNVNHVTILSAYQQLCGAVSPPDTVLFRNYLPDCILDDHKHKAVYVSNALLSFSSLNLHSCSEPAVLLYSSVGCINLIPLLTHWLFYHWPRSLKSQEMTEYLHACKKGWQVIRAVCRICK